MQLLSCGFFLIILTINIDYSQQREYPKDPWRGLPMLCSMQDPKNISISCHGVRIVKRVIQQLLERAINSPSIEITEGINLVDSIDGPTRRARTMKNPIMGFLEDREIRVRLSRFVPKEFALAEKNLAQARGSGGGLGFGGGKKGSGTSFLILALMMGKTLGAVGMGALGMLSMKALMASSLALMLSLLAAAKKFSSGGGHTEDGGHHVVYAQESHHHSKRSMPDLNVSPYRGWMMDIHAIQRST